MPRPRRSCRVRERRVLPPPEGRGPRLVGHTCAAALWFLRAGKLRGVDMLHQLDSIGMAYTAETFYMASRRWERAGLVTIEKVQSRDNQRGAQGSSTENLYGATELGEREMLRVLAVYDLLTEH